MRCAIWCYLRNLKSVKNTHGGVFLLVKLQAKVATGGPVVEHQKITKFYDGNFLKMFLLFSTLTVMIELSEKSPHFCSKELFLAKSYQ